MWEREEGRSRNREEGRTVGKEDGGGGGGGGRGKGPLGLVLGAGLLRQGREAESSPNDALSSLEVGGGGEDMYKRWECRVRPHTRAPVAPSASSETGPAGRCTWVLSPGSAPLGRPEPVHACTCECACACTCTCTRPWKSSPPKSAPTTLPPPPGGSVHACAMAAPGEALPARASASCSLAAARASHRAHGAPGPAGREGLHSRASMPALDGTAVEGGGGGGPALGRPVVIDVAAMAQEGASKPALACQGMQVTFKVGRVGRAMAEQLQHACLSWRTRELYICASCLGLIRRMRLLQRRRGLQA